MSDESRPLDERQPLKLMPDVSYESRHEFAEKLAHKIWEQKGRSLGSQDVDWFAAERSVCASLVASGMIASSPHGSRNIREETYRSSAD